MSLASLLLLPACCHLLSPPATSAAAVCLAKTRPEVARVWKSSWGGFCAISSLASLVALWITNPPRLNVAKIPIGVATNGYQWVLTPTHVPAVVRQSGSLPGQPAWPVTGLTTRVFRRPLLLPTPRVIEYSNDVVFLFHPPHLSYHLPAPLPDRDNSMMIVIVVSVWIVVFI